MSSTDIQEKEAKKIRQRKGVTRPVKAPMGRMSFKLYIYILAAVTLGWAVYYAYRMSEVQRTKAQTFQDNLRKARGKVPSDEQITKNTRETLQQKIEDLSVLLGVEPVVLASAIAGVVKPHMPAASSGSISSQAKASGSVISAFAEGMKNAPSVVPTTAPETTDATTGGGMAASIISAVKEAGFDDMGMDAVEI